MSLLIRANLVVFVLLWFNACTSNHLIKSPKAKKGMLDFSAWDFREKGIVQLNGEWSFYWEQYLNPSDFLIEQTNFIYTTVPNSWNASEWNNQELGHWGYATYRLKVKLNQSYEPLALHINVLNSAGAIYINQKKVYEAGKLGTGFSNTIPAYIPAVVDIPNDNTELDIIIQIANFHRNKGGLWESLEIGTREAIYNQEEISIISDILLFGSILMMALYNLSLYLLRKKEKTALYFSGFCFLIALRIISLNDRLLSNDLIYIPWELLIKVEYLSYYLGLGAFITYIYRIFPRDMSKWMLRLMRVIVLSYTALVILTPNYIHTHLITGFQAFTLIIGCYITWVFFKATLRKRKGGFFFLIIWILFFITIINDILYSNLIIQTAYLTHWSTFLFIFAQNAVLTIRFSSAFEKSEKLNTQLNEVNDNLENIIREKTNELTEAYAVLHKNYQAFKEKDKNITESIAYAQKLQTALLPDLNKIQEDLGDFFVSYQPKDMVSGDFYWYGICQNKIILSAIDCTGHGVPGALMSIMANDVLNDIVFNYHILDPAEILNRLDKKVRETLKQASNNNKDGMDVTLVVIDKLNKKMHFAGANNPLYLIQDNQLQVIKGDRKGIGGHIHKNKVGFQAHCIDLTSDIVFYMASDGYQDQFGGEKGKKFLLSQFRNLLIQIHTLPIQEQKTIVESTLYNWMNPIGLAKENEDNLRLEENKIKFEQTDDILLIGVKLYAEI